MTRCSPWRAALLTLAVMIGGATLGANGMRISGMGISGMGIIQTAHAHALPGSTLIFQPQSQHTLKLTLQFPHEDLLIAAPQLAALGDAKPDAPLPQTLTDQLGDYLSQHMALSKDGDTLPLTLTEAHLTSTYQPQLGDYLLVVTQWNLSYEGGLPDSLLLKYDAVMHEVRNHRAEVEWQTPEGDTRLMADFGFFHSAHGVRLDLSKARQKPAKQE
ncbi:hypothetical protein KDX00_08050 [Cobetia amphilecti]|nr:hypothetical protein KDX00_08050 [Cobetia litoralis]